MNFEFLRFGEVFIDYGETVLDLEFFNFHNFHHIFLIFMPYISAIWIIFVILVTGIVFNKLSIGLLESLLGPEIKIIAGLTGNIKHIS